METKDKVIMRIPEFMRKMNSEWDAFVRTSEGRRAINAVRLKQTEDGTLVEYNTGESVSAKPLGLPNKIKIGYYEYDHSQKGSTINEKRLESKACNMLANSLQFLRDRREDIIREGCLEQYDFVEANAFLIGHYFREVKGSRQHDFEVPIQYFLME